MINKPGYPEQTGGEPKELALPEKFSIQVNVENGTVEIPPADALYAQSALVDVYVPVRDADGNHMKNKAGEPVYATYTNMELADMDPIERGRIARVHGMSESEHREVINVHSAALEMIDQGVREHVEHMRVAQEDLYRVMKSINAYRNDLDM